VVRAFRCRKGNQPRLLAWLIRVEFKVRAMRKQTGVQLELFP